MERTQDESLSDPEIIDLPRQQAGGSSQAILGALLADYTFEDVDELTSDAIVRFLAEFDISASAARSALSRVVKRGLLVPSRQGRSVTYGISDAARRTHRDKLGSVVRFGRESIRWDGEWTIAVYSVPESQRTVRQRLRVLLERSGFAMLADAVWVCPWDRRDHIARIGSDIGVRMAVFRGGFFPSGDSAGLEPRGAFDLRPVRAEYDAFLAAYSHEVAARNVDAGRALVLRTNVLRDWRRIAALDPMMPRELLPGDWPHDEAREVFHHLWSGLGPLAVTRLRDLLVVDDANASAKLRLMDLGE